MPRQAAWVAEPDRGRPRSMALITGAHREGAGPVARLAVRPGLGRARRPSRGAGGSPGANSLIRLLLTFCSLKIHHCRLLWARNGRA